MWVFESALYWSLRYICLVFHDSKPTIASKRILVIYNSTHIFSTVRDQNHLVSVVKDLFDEVIYKSQGSNLAKMKCFSLQYSSWIRKRVHGCLNLLKHPVNSYKFKAATEL